MKKPSIIEPAVKSKHVFMAIHGDSGIGKSKLIGSTPGKLLIIRPPTGHLNALSPEELARVDQAVINDWEEMAEVQTWVRADGDQYDFVWVDDLGGLFDYLLDDVWDAAVKRTPARAEYDVDKGEFGINMNRIARWFRHTVGADKFNFGYTSWSNVTASPDQDEDGDPIDKLMPYIQGKGMPLKMCGMMNVVAYYHKAKIGGKEDRRVLRTESSPRYFAHDKFNALGGRVVDPTMAKVLDKINEARGTAPRPVKRAASGRRRVVRR